MQGNGARRRHVSHDQITDVARGDCSLSNELARGYRWLKTRACASKLLPISNKRSRGDSVRKISFVLAGIVLATFAVGRVDSLAAHRGFGGSIVWAQSWDDLSHDASPQSGDSEPQTAPP